ncbi:tetratricopeptide repeat protein [Pseudomonas putida]|uniref:Tetratricopeptide repeat protein n=1 Tax=Pseudomonas putida TaxID=303 RepID=A0A8I1ECJ4_PSEPU|nr:tetratricopeptide repeat protein [Pseudomonas putida]MBI6884024.1 tetratricopeptide repeat protein [Pseudomonas putida]
MLQKLLSVVGVRAERKPYKGKSEIIKMGSFCQVHVRSKNLPTVIVFSSVNVARGRYKPYKSILTANANIIFVNDNGNNWYLKGIRNIGAGWKSSARAVVEKARSIGNGKVITFGCSMGAYGAFLYGAYGKADLCIGFGSEFCLDLPGSRSERFKPKHVSLRFETLMKMFEESKSRFVLYVGETDEVDLYSALPLLRLKNFNVLSVRGVQHPAVQPFEKLMGLGAFLDQACTGYKKILDFPTKGSVFDHPALIRDLWTAECIKSSGNFRLYLDFLCSISKEYSGVSIYMYRLGEAYCRVNELDKGIACLKKSLELDDLQHRCYNMIGFATRRSGDDEGAKKYFMDAVRLSPRDARPYFNLGLLLKDLGDVPGAYENISKAIEIAPNVPEYSSAIESLNESCKVTA